MTRQPRQLQPGFCYHITVRCNNREFNLRQPICRQLLLYCIQKHQNKFGYKLYGLCITSNHVHYLLEPELPEDLPKIMHWLNWYTAMCFNRLLRRKGHFWEQRYHSSGFESSEHDRVLNTLRYIHANPKAARMQAGFFYDFSNYGSYDRLVEDGLTQWHQAFLYLGQTLEECATQYRGFCRRYKPKRKETQYSRWGSSSLSGLSSRLSPRKRRSTSPGQTLLPVFQGCQVSVSPEIDQVISRFLMANSYQIGGA